MSRHTDTTRLAEELGRLVDPLLRRPLGELGMVGEVTAGRRGAACEIVLPVDEHPELGALQAAAREVVERICGRGDVRFSGMTARQRAELAERLRRTIPALGAGLDAGREVVAVASGKGGVGKSTVTANLAVALADAGRRVAVLDADVWGHSIPHMFGVRENPRTLGGLMLPVRAHGVDLMSVGFFVGPDDAVVWRGPMLHKALEQMLGDTFWDSPDVLLVDLPPGTGDITLSFLELVPEAALLAVTTPGAAASSVARRVVRMAREQGMPVAGVVENMSSAVCAHCGGYTAVFGEGGGAELAALAEAPLLGQVPLDVAARAAGDTGTPVVAADPAAASTLAFRTIAAGLRAPRRSLVGRSLPLSVV